MKRHNLTPSLQTNITHRANISKPRPLQVMIYLIDSVLPERYFVDNLRSLSVDMAVFRQLLKVQLPRLSCHLDRLQADSTDLNTGSLLRHLSTLISSPLPSHYSGIIITPTLYLLPFISIFNLFPFPTYSHSQLNAIPNLFPFPTYCHFQLIPIPNLLPFPTYSHSQLIPIPSYLTSTLFSLSPYIHSQFIPKYTI